MLAVKKRPHHLQPINGVLDARRTPVDCSKLLLDSAAALNLASCGLGAHGVAALTGPIASSASLTAVDLHNNGLGDEGAALLAKVLERNSTIRSLSLQMNAIQNDGCSALCAALTSDGSAMTSLNLAHNRIGTDGIDGLLE